ncbi:MAG: crotonase/enoyl-CoA hydratase family protein [Acidimicrobiales bacterium]|jgi:enoyl-CoA hydratase/carnithine racemase
MSDATTETPPEEPLIRQRHGKVELLRINRERARNAIDGPTSIALGRALEEIAADDDVWVVVLTGTGEKAFSAGMDLKAFAAGQAGDIMSAEHGFANIARRNFPKPLIAAVNGVALAGGCEIVLSCDLVVAAEHAAFGIPEVKRGLVAAGGGLLRLHQRIPYSIALELALTGETISAQRAAELGFVNRVVPAEQVVPEALALAEKICENAPLSVRASKEIMRRSIGLTEDAAWDLNTQLIVPIFTSRDAMEGATAFAEKRPPVWSGS